MSSGLNYTCALTTVATVDCWGNNDNGQATDQITTTYYLLDHHEKEEADKQRRAAHSKKAKLAAATVSPLRGSKTDAAKPTQNNSDGGKHCIIS